MPMTDRHPIDRRTLKFVRALLRRGQAEQGENGRFRVLENGRSVQLEAARVRELISLGVLQGAEKTCSPGRETRQWLKRAMADGDEFSTQHRNVKMSGDGVQLNLNEGPVARLSRGQAGQPPFLQPHQVQAAQRFHGLFRRALMAPSTTLSYDPARTRSPKPAFGVPFHPAETACQARQALKRCLAGLPADCAGVVMDVCGYEKGLQLVETERGWPRRSAKILLRAGLDQLAGHFGLLPVARGAETGAYAAWMDEGARPEGI